MAQAKKDGGKSSAKKKAAASEEHADSAVEASEAESSTESSGKVAAAAHGGAHGHAGAHHAPNRKEYMVIFLVLFVLTVLEVIVAQIPGLSKTLLGLALVGLAVSKASIVGLYYMHLKHETKVMRLTVAIPMATPAVYAVILIAEGAWRLAR
jgi:cytochrome c oxidase subunit IV